MKRKKGDLPGRYVLPYLRTRPDEPTYVKVSGYQEQVDPIPSPLECVPPQGEFDFLVGPNPE